MALALRTADVKTGLPGPDRSDALTRFDSSTLLVAGERDPLLSADWLYECSQAFLPVDTERVTLTDERHFPSVAGQRAIVTRIRSFLSSES